MSVRSRILARSITPTDLHSALLRAGMWTLRWRIFIHCLTFSVRGTIPTCRYNYAQSKSRRYGNLLWRTWSGTTVSHDPRSRTRYCDMEFSDLGIIESKSPPWSWRARMMNSHLPGWQKSYTRKFPIQDCWSLSRVVTVCTGKFRIYSTRQCWNSYLDFSSSTEATCKAYQQTPGTFAL